MITLQITILVLLALGTYKFTGSHMHPAGLMIYSWMFMLFWHILPLVKYEYPVLSPELLLLQTAFVVLFIAGSLINIPLQSWQRCPAPSSVWSSRSQSDAILFLLAAAVPVLGGCVAIEMLTKGNSVLNLSEMRAAHWEEADGVSTPLSLIKAVSRPGVLTLILMTPVLRSQLLLTAAFLGFVTTGIGESLLAGGRAYLGFCIAGLGLSAILGREAAVLSPVRRLLNGKSAASSPGRTLAWTTAGSVLFVLCFGVFPSVRNPDLIGREDMYLSFETGASEISREVRTISSLTGVENVSVFAYGTHYLTSPMMRSNYLLRETDASRWLLMGGNNFPMFSKVRWRLIGGETTEQQAKEKIAASQPFGRNPWIGGVTDVMIDFGVIGGGAFMLIYGMFSGWLYRSWQTLMYPEYLAAIAVVSLTLVAFPYSGIIRWSMTTNTIITCACVSAVRVAFGTASVGVTGESVTMSNERNR